MSMHRRLPIKTTKKCWMHLARAAHVVLVIDRMIWLVRIFFLNTLQRQRSEMRGL